MSGTARHPHRQELRPSTRWAVPAIGVRSSGRIRGCQRRRPAGPRSGHASGRRWPGCRCTSGLSNADGAVHYRVALTHQQIARFKHHRPGLLFGGFYRHKPHSRTHRRFNDRLGIVGIMDRIVHNAHRIELKGDSMRRKDQNENLTHMENHETMPSET